jgi:hypothetical protein
MSPTNETTDNSYRGVIIIVDFVSDQSPFLGFTLVDLGRPLEDLSLVVYFDRFDRRPDDTTIRYLGDLLAPRDYHLEQFVRRELQLAQAAAFPRPPLSLGRSIPARQRPVRGAKLSNGGWR